MFTNAGRSINQLGRAATKRIYNRVAAPIFRRRPLWLDRRNFDAGLKRQEQRIAPLGGLSSTASVMIESNDRIPQMAWLGIRQGRSYRFVVGRTVERFPEGFFEGIWDGDFGAFHEIASRNHSGSGVLFDAPDPLFMPPKNPREYIFVLRDKETRTDYVSNSLCFCFAAAGVTSGDAIFQAADACLVESTKIATRQGVYRYDPRVAETGRHALLRLMHNNFRISADGRFDFDQAFTGKKFASFAAYREHLSGTVAAAFRNATDPARATPLPPITTISSGYDSTAVAVIASENGCREAVTLKVSVYGNDDSGEQIADRLGLDVRSFDHVAGTEIRDLRMAFDGDLRKRAHEFIATAGIGDDITFAAFEPALAGRMLLSGAFGDGFWDKGFPMRPGLPLGIRFGKSMSEFRLRVGFAHLAPIFAGGMSPASVSRIANSAEMKPFSIGGRYDRPIARRIVEEAGVPREMFGMKKAATSPDPINHAALWAEATESVMERYRL